MDKSQHEVAVVVEDRLSSLPDDILINILDHLDWLNSAVKCLIVSKRWNIDHLWNYNTCVDIRTRKFSSDPLQFWTSLNKAVLKLTAPSITRFSLDLFYGVFNGGGCWSQIDTLFRRLGDLNTENISVTSCDNRTSNNGPVMAWHSTCVFEISTLVSLELGSKDELVWKLPGVDSVINLPKLKKLTIHVMVTPLRNICLGRLINSCPSLEDLSFSIIGSTTQGTLSIYAHNLRRLHTHLNSPYQSVVADVPRLEHFTFYGNCPFSFVTNPISLTEADIIIYRPRHMRQSSVLRLLDSVSHVKTLKFGTSRCFYEALENRLPYEMIPTFPKLTCLELDMKSSLDFKALGDLVQLCPALEKIIMSYGIEHSEIKGLFSSLLNAIPNVKMVEIRSFKVENRLLDFLRNMLRIVPNLEELIVTGTCRELSNDENKLEFAEKLSQCLRSSPCRIKLCGRYLE